MENLKRDYRTDKLLKDRGDSLRKSKQFKKENGKYESDRGDTVRNKPPEKTSESDKKNEMKREYVKHESSKRQNDFDKEVNRLLDRRKRIRDKYTVKNYGPQDLIKPINNDDLGLENKKDTLSNTQKHIELKDRIDLKKSTRADKEKPSKVPVIRTITSKKDAKVYKAVTFTAQKLNPVTPLQIKIPMAAIKKTRTTKLINQNKIKTISKTSVKPNSERRRPSGRKSKRWQKRQASSPVLVKDGDSPPTEVAKWAPSCINKHTKPYYEAWVNTTLAATSRSSKKIDVERDSILQFRRVFERTESPELLYNDYKDERYAGKIKVNHK